MNSDYNYIFYDFEVFKYDWLVVFIDVINKKRKIIVNDKDKLRSIEKIKYNIDAIYISN